MERAVLGYKKIVIPYRIEDVAMSENLEFFLTDVHWLDAFPDDTVFENLVKAVKNALKIGDVSHSAHEPDDEPGTEPVPENEDEAPGVDRRRSLGEINQEANALKDSAKELYEGKEYIRAAVKYEKAAANFNELYERYKIESDLNWAAHLYIMAGICYQGAKHSKARESYLQALDGYKLLVELYGGKYKKDLGRTYSNLGTAYEVTDERQSLEYYEKCMEMWEDFRDDDEVISADYKKVKVAVDRFRAIYK